MAERPLTDDALADALRDLGAEIAYPPTPDLAPAVQRRIAAGAARPRRVWYRTPTARRLALAFVLLLMALGVVLGGFPQARGAVARRLGLQHYEIVVTVVLTPTAAPTATPFIPTTLGPIAPPTPRPPPTVAPLRAQLGTPTTRDDAQMRVRFPIIAPQLPALGTPDEVYLDSLAPGGKISLLYRARGDLPAIAGTDVGLLLTEFGGGIEPGFFGKGVTPETQIEPVAVNGAAGYWITGGLRGFGYRGADGSFRFEDVRVTGNTLLWERDGVIYRLETSLPKDDALRIAASVG